MPRNFPTSPVILTEDDAGAPRPVRYLARYFTGEAASSLSDEAVRVLPTHANR